MGANTLHLQQGNELGKQGDLDRAFEHFQLALAEDPDCAEAHFGQAAIWYKRNELFRAEQSLVRVLQLDPRNERAQKLLARCEHQQKMRSSAFPGMDAGESLVQGNRKSNKSTLVVFGVIIPLLIALAVGYYLLINQ